jgi:ornithine carbamoyltransferase
MRNLIRLDDWSPEDIHQVFSLADKYQAGYGPRFSGSVVMFFPPTSLRTRVSFERGAALMNLQTILFPSETLDKPEDLTDIAKYLQPWTDALVVRHPDITKLEQLASTASLPIINAMTDVNHPCEVLSDLYALHHDHKIQQLRFLFVGADGNIVRAWQEAANVLGLNLIQCCPRSLAAPSASTIEDLHDAIRSADVILTDAHGSFDQRLAPYRITQELLNEAPEGVLFNPCPPFMRGAEISADALEHRAFVGHRFKASLLPVQQAIMAFCIGSF